jgi:predicted permease
LLSLTGAVLGLGIAKWGTDAVLAALPAALPRAEEVHLDSHVLFFTLGISLLSGIVFGLVPALKTMRPDLHETLKEGGRGGSGRHHRAQNVFVVFETALALVLLVGAGLMTRTLAKLWTDNPGFDSHQVLTFNATLSPTKTSTAPLMRNSYRALEDRYAAIPGVDAVALMGGSLPMRGDSELPFWREGQPKPASDNDMSWALFYAVTPGYWKSLKIPLLRGRLLTAQDNETSAPVIVVDQRFAERFFPNEDALGKRINLGLVETQPQIVGIVGHVNHWGLGATAHGNLEAQLYLPTFQFPDKFAPLFAHGLTVVARTNGDPESFSSAIRSATSAFDSQAVVYEFVTMDRIVSDSIASQRFSMWLLGSFAVLALVLSAVGIYGVISYFVGQRTQEVGIRMALGARRQDVLMLILGQGARMALIGVALGLVAALALTRLMASMLYGVRSTDPLTFAGVAIVLAGIAIAATYIPALRATRVDPMVALRYE